MSRLDPDGLALEFHTKFHRRKHVYTKPNQAPRLNGKINHSHGCDEQEFYQLLNYRDEIDLEEKI